MKDQDKAAVAAIAGAGAVAAAAAGKVGWDLLSDRRAAAGEAARAFEFLPGSEFERRVR